MQAATAAHLLQRVCSLAVAIKPESFWPSDTMILALANSPELVTAGFTRTTLDLYQRNAATNANTAAANASNNFAVFMCA